MSEDDREYISKLLKLYPNDDECEVFSLSFHSMLFICGRKWHVIRRPM